MKKQQITIDLNTFERLALSTSNDGRQPVHLTVVDHPLGRVKGAVYQASQNEKGFVGEMTLGAKTYWVYAKYNVEQGGTTIDGLDGVEDPDVVALAFKLVKEALGASERVGEK